VKINDGREYEKFVASIQYAIIHSDVLASQRNIKIEVNKKIIDSCGCERQFDIFWEYDFGGITYRTAIECKDYKLPVSIDRIDALIGKIRDIPGLKGVFATRVGYQSGAKTKAEKNGIELLIIREQTPSDWEDEYGNPLIKKLVINLVCAMPARILEFSPVANKEWLQSNRNLFPTTASISLAGMNNEILIDDVETGRKYSLLDLTNDLAPAGEPQYGEFEKVVELRNAFVCNNELRVKIDSYKIRYLLRPPITEEFEIDFTKELVGVVEYLQKGRSKRIFKNGVVV
jgi:hypothetical protein